jgi:hypothetical protein
MISAPLLLLISEEEKIPDFIEGEIQEMDIPESQSPAFENTMEYLTHFTGQKR